jgi:hypothetical protein
MKDAELEVLLSACPQLLKLSCAVRQSWNVVLLAARYCRLLQLTVDTLSIWHQVEHAAAADCQPVVIPSPFLPHLIILELTEARPSRQRFVSDFSILSHFTAPPHAELRHIAVDGPSLTAQHVLELARLRRLANVSAIMGGSPIEELHEASARPQLQLIRMRGGAAARQTDDDTQCRTTGRAWEGTVEPPPLSPHHQQEMRQRVLGRAAACRRRRVINNCLCTVEGGSGDRDCESSVLC